MDPDGFTTEKIKMKTFFALITKPHSTGKHTDKCVGRILEMRTGNTNPENYVSEQLDGRGNCDFDTRWSWCKNTSLGDYEILPNLSREAFNAHWGIKLEVKPKAAIDILIDASDFGCQKENVRKLAWAIVEEAKKIK